MMSNLDRLTEYHNGVAVIRDKNKLKEAMEKLASYEDVEEDSDMERVSREMSFDEEFVYLKEEFEKVVEREDPQSEPSFVNCVLRRAMRCIRKQGEELRQYKDLEEQGLLLKLNKDGDVIE